MVDIIGLIMANSGLILMIISLLLALVARYFQTKADALAKAAQAVLELSQTALDAVKDGVMTQEELDAILAKIATAQAAIKEAIDVFFPPATPTQMLGAILFGYKSDELSMAMYDIQTVQNKLAKK